MPGYPLVNTDTVLYEKKDIYADKDINLSVLDGSRLNIWGQAYLNGVLLPVQLFAAEAFGAKGDGVTNDTGAIQAAIDAAYTAGGGTVVLGPGKNYRITSEIFIKNYVNLIGVTAGQGSPSCISTSGTGRVRFGDGTAAHAYGGESGNFTINGAAGGDTTGLLVTNHNAHCTFNTIEIDNAPGVGMRVSESQNCVFIGINIQSCASDGLILDRGCGGNLFLRVEVNQIAAAGYHLRFIGGVGGVGTYLSPTHNSFHHCIFERPQATQSKGIFRSEACGGAVFDNCAFVGDVVGRGDATPPALVDIDGTSDITLRDCLIQGGGGAGQSGIYVKSATLNISNRLRLNALLNGVTMSTGVSGLWDYVSYGTVTTKVNLVDSSNRNNISRVFDGGVRITFDDTMPSVFQIFKDGEANPRFSYTNLGNMWWGPGNVAVDTWMQRWGVNSLKTNGEFVIGGNLTHQGTKVGFNNTAPVVKPTVSGAKASNAALASLLTALASMGLITDSSTA